MGHGDPGPAATHAVAERSLRVVVAGGYGRTGALVVRQLAAAGHQATGLVRREHQLPRIAARGATGVLLDLTTVASPDLARVLAGADALVIATGSSYGDTAEEALAIDRDAPITCIDAAVAAAVPHVVLLSAHRTDEDFGDEQTLTVLRAKRAADAHLRSQGSLRWIILRPDALSDEEPTGLVKAGERVPQGSLSRADLAAVVVAALSTDGSSAQFELTGGHTPVQEAVRRLTRA